MFNNDEKAIIKRAAVRVWETIARDVFEGCDDGATIDRADVVDVVLDADRLTSELRRSGHADIAQRVDDIITSRDLERLVASAFPHREYGL